jgi:DNA-binding NarL/FixJ family response regulator
MNALAPKPIPMTAQGLRVLVIAAEPERLSTLVQIVREAGHVAVTAAQDAALVLADGVPPPALLPAVALGPSGDDVQGLLPKDASPEQIDAALRAVAAGLRVSPAEEQGPAFAALDDHVGPLLTPRELEVLSAVADGLTNKEIARLLGISLHTVKFHLESLMRKLGATSRAGALAKAMRLHLFADFHA